METLSQSKSVLDGYTCLVLMWNAGRIAPIWCLGNWVLDGISTHLSGSVVCVVLCTGVVTNFVELPEHGRATRLDARNSLTSSTSGPYKIHPINRSLYGAVTLFESCGIYHITKPIGPPGIR